MTIKMTMTIKNFISLSGNASRQLVQIFHESERKKMRTKMLFILILILI